jgi:hypothetical protein
MINLFKDENLLNFYKDKSLWVGCFGGMTTITHDFLTQVNNKYNISLLLDVVVTRHYRIAFERVIACLLQFEAPQITRFGDILKYSRYGIKYEDRAKYPHHPLLKVWTGR